MVGRSHITTRRGINPIIILLNVQTSRKPLQGMIHLPVAHIIIPGNEDKVKIIDGNLEVDGKILDKNTFFCLGAPLNKSTNFKLLCWNINGVKNKFLSENVKNILKNKNILILSETHLYFT